MQDIRARSRISFPAAAKSLEVDRKKCRKFIAQPNRRERFNLLSRGQICMAESNSIEFPIATSLLFLVYLPLLAVYFQLSPRCILKFINVPAGFAVKRNAEYVERLMNILIINIEQWKWNIQSAEKYGVLLRDANVLYLICFMRIIIILHV